MKISAFEDKLDALIEEAFGLGVEEGQFREEDIITALERTIIAIRKGLFGAIPYDAR